MPAPEKNQFQRTCIGCYNKKSKHELLRMVLAFQREMVIDLDAKLPGKGVYICPSKDCLNLALKKKRVISEKDLRAEIINKFEDKLCALIGLSYKAGKAVSGQSNLLKALKNKNIKLLLLANDIGQNLKKKYLSLANKEKIRPYYIFDSIRLGELLGKSPRNAVGIKEENFALKIDNYIRQKEKFL
jgi:predicted RNA-binding protein YlxR (DUF448 family)